VKPHELYKLLEPAVVAEMFTTFRDEEREIYKSAVASLAQARKLRPVYVQKKPVKEQIEWMHKTLALRSSDMIGEHLLQVWFMKFQQPLLVGFCDGMGIEHNGEGSVEGTLPEDLDSGKLEATVDQLYAGHNPRIVSLYLHVFNLQTPGGWESLTELLQSDPRVKLGAEQEEAPEPPPEPPPAAESPPESEKHAAVEPPPESEKHAAVEPPPESEKHAAVEPPPESEKHAAVEPPPESEAHAAAESPSDPGEEAAVPHDSAGD